MSNSIEYPTNKVETKERGKNVKIVLKFIRHGERTKEGQLTDYGRKITAICAKESGIKPEDFDAVKAIGSTAGPKGPGGLQRSLESADIYAHEIAGDGALETRGSDVLDYENLKSPAHFDHTTVYNSFLPPDFEKLSDEEKAKAAKYAQRQMLERYFSDKTPEGEAATNEVAGSFAYIIDWYIKMTKRLESGSEVLMPAGTHGGTMEFLLQKALVYKDRDGVEHTGFELLDAINGEFDPSEAFNVTIETDDKGGLKEIKVTFDNAARPQGDMHLDLSKLDEARKYYLELHPEHRKYEGL
ncbi:MAG: hypothetical protein HZA94_00705 [Candidatus Vogelbacteria bacterium]|nr:hypothetical protein [Candidatus Vogelbacteria bacterium]